MLIDNNSFHKVPIERTSTFDQMIIFKEMSLLDIFKSEEVEKLLKEPIFKMEDEVNTPSISCSFRRKALTPTQTHENSLMFDRMSLILKLLQLSIDKLNKAKEDTVAKGLEW
jgi:hypothetical protein